MPEKVRLSAEINFGVLLGVLGVLVWVLCVLIGAVCILPSLLGLLVGILGTSLQVSFSVAWDKILKTHKLTDTWYVDKCNCLLGWCTVFVIGTVYLLLGRRICILC